MIEYTNSEIRNKIDELIHSERNRDLLKRRLIDGLTYERLAEEFDMSVRQVKNIIYKEQEKVLKYFL
jgi:DNA-directed RNA polymerase specialized sigma24 family protein